MNVPGLVFLQAQGEVPIWGNPLFMMVAILAIFYLLLIRPQNQQRKQHEAMLKSIEKGDSVVTSGGLHGKVTGTTDDVLTIEIANLKGERVRVKVDRARVERRTEKGSGEISS